MKKLFAWIWENILFLETLLLLFFIPLYPKLPLINVRHTWVYVRADDFVVLFVLLSWLVLLFRKKISFRTPLTIPILVFWMVGAVATTHGVLLIFPTLANVFPNVAFLSLLRHIEYMSLFFVAYQGMKDKRLLPVVIGALIITLLGVIGYGFGQRYLEFPAFLTMNEQFAKGAPIILSQLSRIPSTFAGQYDLAAYLVLIIPILASLFFGFKNWLIKLSLLATSALGFVLLLMTVSRVSFFALLAALFIILFFQKKKIILFTVPIVVLLAVLIISFQPSLLSRFQSTIKETNVLVEAKTGESIGNLQYVPTAYFKDKIILWKAVKDREELINAITTESGTNGASSSAIVPFKLLPPEVPLVLSANTSNGENLPSGTGYINLALSPVIAKLDSFYYELPPEVKASFSAQVLVLKGDFVVKKAAAYDLSFTTRFQGEWPNALLAFQRNILIGSGYGSASLAVDNNYLRMLAETGLLGFISFLVIFLSLGIYIKKIFPDIESKLAKSFILGFAAGVVGLALNATLIDVFEASKVAYILWLLFGVVFGVLVLYQKNAFNLFAEIKRAATSSYAIITYLLSFSIVLFSPTLGNFFIGDDFTWFRWVADHSRNSSLMNILISYFTDANGFFYRPGTKIYFFLMYSNFWLNQVVYHAVSIFLHFVVAALFFLLAKRVFKNNLLAALAAFLFLLMSGSTEAIYWISATGFLFNAVFALSSLLFFILWDERRKVIYYLASLLCLSLGLLFHEMGVIIPLLIIAYGFKDKPWSFAKEIIKKKDYLLLFVPVLGYFLMRLFAHSHWLNGDYSYDLLKLPFNFIGNALGYISLILVGQVSLPFYEAIRNILKGNMLLAIILTVLGILLLILAGKKVPRIFEKKEKNIIVFGFLFFIISLLPFLGLGNITSRYSYLASLGLIMIFVILIKKVYFYLLTNGKEIAFAATSVLIIVFSLFHIIQLQQSYFDWGGAGVKAENFFISIDDLYKDSWSNAPVNLHFVNVPIKYGDAWVFPVGLKDAVWFAFKNDQAKVYLHNDLQSTLQQVQSSSTTSILQFNDDGSVSEIMNYPK
jgi:hypothetical protein